MTTTDYRSSRDRRFSRLIVPAMLAVAFGAPSCGAPPDQLGDLSVRQSAATCSDCVGGSAGPAPANGAGLAGAITSACEIHPGDPTRPGTPLRMVVLGDSIAWGQGISDDGKFSTIVQQAMQVRQNRPVQREVCAHSGAPLEGDPGLEAAAPQHPMPLTYGELPTDLPSIEEEIGLVAHPEDVSLIIMDGGINDLGVQTILTSTDDQDLIQRTWDACGVRMERVLKKTMLRFSQARAVVTPYYPIVSFQSDETLVRALADILLTPQHPFAGLEFSAIRNLMAHSSQVFNDVCTAALAGAVRGVNQALPVPRVAFASLAFGAQNSYAAPQSFLWDGIHLDDDVHAQRVAACANSFGMKPYCAIASIGHPNRAGAWAYATPLIDIVTRMGQLNVAISPGEMLPANQVTTVTVSAQNAAFASPVSGLVLFDDGTVEPTNQPFTRTFVPTPVIKLGHKTLTYPKARVQVIGYDPVSIAFPIVLPTLRVTVAQAVVNGASTFTVMAVDATTGTPVTANVLFDSSVVGQTGVPFRYPGFSGTRGFCASLPKRVSAVPTRGGDSDPVERPDCIDGWVTSPQYPDTPIR